MLGSDLTEADLGVDTAKRQSCSPPFAIYNIPRDENRKLRESHTAMSFVLYENHLDLAERAAMLAEVKGNPP